jgi:hypothetical protein
LDETQVKTIPTPKRWKELTTVSDEELYLDLDSELFRKAVMDSLNDLLTELDARTTEVLKRRFGLSGQQSQTLQEVAVFFGVTRERIRQIEAKGLRKLRQPSRAGALRAFFDPDTDTKALDRLRGNKPSLSLEELKAIHQRWLDTTAEKERRRRSKVARSANVDPRYQQTHCSLCGSLVKPPQTKWSHMRDHHPRFRFRDNPDTWQHRYACSLCLTQIASVFNLIKHYQSVHPKQVEIR